MDQLALDAWRGFSALNDSFFTLSHFEDGSVVEAGLIGGEVAGVKVSPDSRFEGVLEEGSSSIIRLTDTDSPDMANVVGRQIGLSVRTNLGTPGGVVEATLRSCIRKNGEMAYYFPEDIGPDNIYGYPREDQFHRPTATYGWLNVNGVVLFDQKDNSFLFD